MAIDTAELDSDLSEIINDFPVTFTTSNNGATTFTGTRTNKSEMEELEVGGQVTDYDFNLICRTAVFVSPSTVPNVGDKITIASVAYRIEQKFIADEPSGKEIQFKLKSSKK